MRGARGISLIVVPGDSKGLSRRVLHKMGWLCSDTSQLNFDNVRVPARYLVGQPGDGFKMIMGNFNGERLGMSVAALGFAQACFDGGDRVRPIPSSQSKPNQSSRRSVRLNRNRPAVGNAVPPFATIPVALGLLFRRASAARTPPG